MRVGRQTGRQAGKQVVVEYIKQLRDYCSVQIG
jgi:hypothetical protein